VNFLKCNLLFKRTLGWTACETFIRKLEKLADQTSIEFKSGSVTQSRELGLGLFKERGFIWQHLSMERSWLSSASHPQQARYDCTPESYFFHSSSK